MTKLQQQLNNQFSNLDLALSRQVFQFDYPLAQLSYYKIGGSAEVYLELAEKDQIVNVVKYFRQKDVKLTVLGEASNVLIADEGVSGVVLRIKYDVISKKKSVNDDKLGDGKSKIKVGAGIKLSILVRNSIEMGLTGLEYFFGIPGTLGGAVYNNAHYREFLIGNYINTVQVINGAGELVTLDQKDCDFSYDHSRFHKSKEVILEVEFILESGNKEESQQIIKELTQRRTVTQPLGLASCGCVFKNIPNDGRLRELFPQFKDKDYVPSAFLIDQAGLKGLCVGDIEVSDQHAAFFVNKDKGTARDVRSLIEKVRQKVKNKFDVTLEEEVFYLS